MSGPAFDEQHIDDLLGRQTEISTGHMLYYQLRQCIAETSRANAGETPP